MFMYAPPSSQKAHPKLAVYYIYSTLGGAVFFWAVPGRRPKN